MRSIVLDNCLYDHDRRYELHAAVVMINHVHLLFSPLLDTKGEAFKLADIMKALKGSSARSVNKATFDYGSYWQDESFHHLARTAEDFGHHYGYILMNAAQVTPGSNPYDYPWLWTPSKAQTGVSVPPENLRT